MSNKKKLNNPIISAEQVADYLHHHRDFFIDKLSLLADMHLIDDTGDAVSLIERQVAILRERNIDMRQRMNKLLENARVNYTLFEKSKRLILNLLNAEDLEDIIDTLLYSLHNEFGIQYTSLLIYGEHRQTLVDDCARIVPIHEAKKHLDISIDNHRAVCSPIPVASQSFIFGNRASSINSTAVVCLNHSSPLGLLAIGHKDAKYFHADMGTLFLSYIGDVLARLLPKKMAI